MSLLDYRNNLTSETCHQRDKLTLYFFKPITLHCKYDTINIQIKLMMIF